ncbi:uncharacterized protein LOC122552147 isoform X2 [Chiloscyllium plagiosum]|nr:uncharacterized protein LOC122552147 isoform X2 [Chiloscyllium plagiosum]XP_043550582.1 uncharacterized protein LOC122552147 isoform X2 [Chiloscyllium plagiosum]XP_043550583.1 uncharacterized protein LOC122552147 isoform X2 [Chiloscyllium plagiosum]
MRTLLLFLGLMFPNSKIADPCVNHTVLDPTRRSIKLGLKECLYRDECGNNLQQGWYSFNSSGEWMIPENAIPIDHCCTRSTGWLNGRHPSVSEGEVTRTICFNWNNNNCSSRQDIIIKKCSTFFVYELKPTQFCNAGYCAERVPTQRHKDLSTTFSIDIASPDSSGSETSTLNSFTLPSNPTEFYNLQTDAEQGSPHQWVHVMITSDAEIDNKKAKKITLKTVRDSTIQRGQTQITHIQCHPTSSTIILAPATAYNNCFGEELSNDKPLIFSAWVTRTKDREES